MTSATPLTGEQYTIRHGDYEATICEQGAILRVLRWKGTDLIAPFDADRPDPCCNGYMLMPYPNRIEEGRYTFEGKTYQFPIDEPERNTSLHGTGYRAFWKVVDQQADTVSLEWHNAAEATSYPFKVRARVRYTLTDDGLRLEMTAFNDGTVDAPWAFGIHPCGSPMARTCTATTILTQNAKCTLRLGARTHVTVDGNLVPNGTEPAEVSRSTCAVRPSSRSRLRRRLDRCRPRRQGRLERHIHPSRRRVGDDQRRQDRQRLAGVHRHGLPAESHPSGGVVEPMTGYANAFRTGKNLVVPAGRRVHHRPRIPCRQGLTGD